MKTSLILTVFLMISLFLMNCASIKKPKSIYITPENETKILAMYDAKLKHWPVPYESIFVPTRYGETHIIACGKEDAPPIVLLHAMGLTATMWLPNIKALSQNYRTYAIDTIGDLGKSYLYKLDKYPKNGESYSKWLNDVFNELGIEKAYVIGASMGGWIAMNHAIYSPERINKLVLLGPMGIPSATLRVMWRLMSIVIFPTKSNKEKLIKWVLGNSSQVNEAYTEYMRTALNCRGKMAVPKKLSDNELRSIKVSTLLFLGGNDSPIGDPLKVKKRAEKFIPDIKVVIIKLAGHVMSTENPDFVNSHILEFFKQ